MLERRDQIAPLLTAIRQPGTQVAVIHGGAGAGKTWLAERLLDAAAAEQQLTGAGKYGEGDGQAPLAPIIAALSGLVEAALARLYDRQTGIASLTDALGIDLDVLVGAGLVAPGLPTRTTLKALTDRRRGMTRITGAVLNLLAWTERFGVGRVLLIDDWWRGTDDATALLEAMADTMSTQPLTIVMTQRADCALPTFASATVTSCHLPPLGHDEASALLADRLGAPEPARLVLDALGDFSPRTPLELVQLGAALRHSRAIVRHERCWSLDTAALGALAYDAPGRIAALAATPRRLAAILAAWGDAAPRDGLRRAIGDEVDDAGFAAAVDELHAQGIVHATPEQVSFSHDRLREAAVAAVPADERAARAAAVAARLGNTDRPVDEEFVALRLRHEAGLDDASPATWRDRFVMGAMAARGRGDADTASLFAEAALALHERAPAPAPRLILREALLAAADRNDPVTVPRAAALVAAATNPAELFEDYETAIVSLRLAEQGDAAWAMAQQGLARAGITMPGRRHRALAFVRAIARWRVNRLFPAGSGGALPALDAFSAMAGTAATVAYHIDPRLTAIIGCRASLIVRGTSSRSSYWFGVDGFLFASLGARALAARSGERALRHLPEQRVLRAASLYQGLFFGALWTRPLAEQREHFREVTRIGLGEGDLIFACYGLRIFVMSGWRTAPRLEPLLDEAIEARAALRRLGEASFVDEMDAMVALLSGLTGRTPWSPALWRDDITTRNHAIDLELPNLVGDWPETLRRARLLHPLRRDYAIQVDSVVMRFHETIARLRCGLSARRGDLGLLREAAMLNPADHQAKLLLVEAERLRRRGAATGRQREAYAAAVVSAGESASRLDAVVALRCAADAAATTGDPTLAAHYRGQADAVLAQWGAAGLRHGEAERPAPELAARAAAAERAGAAKSRLLAHVGHELRTPLQALRSIVDLGRDEQVPVDVRDIAAVIGSLGTVVDDLDLIGGLSDRDDRAGECVDLVALVRSEIAVCADRARVTLRCDPDVIDVAAAGQRVRQVLRNLLGNAIKYGGGGSIAVSLDAAATVSGRLAVALAVSDQGPGLGADPERLFAAFERGDFAGDGAGSGLGLALSRAIAERLGGRLDAANAPGGGARFCLSFEASPGVPHQPLAARGAAPSLILLVEDDALLRRLVARMLERARHRVIEAGDVTTARARWAAGVDLVICDVQLPGGNGLDLLAEMRAAGSMTPVVLLTATNDSATRAAADTYPAARLMRKPASEEALVGMVAELLGAQGLPPSPPLPPAEFARMKHAAQAEVVRQARCCIAEPDARQLHALAGLSLQFGWQSLGEAAEQLELAMSAGAALDPARARLRAALDELV